MIQSKEEIQSQVRQTELLDYYGIHIFDCDGYGRITADETIMCEDGTVEKRISK